MAARYGEEAPRNVAAKELQQKLEKRSSIWQSPAKVVATTSVSKMCGDFNCPLAAL